MSVANKTRALLNLTGHKPSELAECLGKSIPSVRNKFSQDVFSVYDLIRIADYLDCRLLFQTQDGQTVYLGMDDLKEVENQSKNLGQEGELTKMDALILDAVLNPAIPPEGTKVITGEDIIKRYNNGMQED